MSLEDLYCQVDDFCQEFMPKWHSSLIEEGVRRKPWLCQMSASEIMTIVILFHQKRYRDFKTFYTQHVQKYWRDAFPKLLSYSRFVEQMSSVTLPLFFFMIDIPVLKNGLYFVDSTTLKVCHIKREKQHKVFKNTAEKSKSTMGWFYGFKLHIVVNSCGEIANLKLTGARVDDRTVVPDLTEGLFGKLIGDKGYISTKLKEKLMARGLELLTKIKKNMKARALAEFDKILVRKRAIIESVIDQLKNISQIEHTRHRSQHNFLTNIVAGLTAYALQPKKPSLDIKFTGLAVV